MLYLYNDIKGSGPECYTSTMISRVLDQNGISQECYLVEIYHSGPEPLR